VGYRQPPAIRRETFSRLNSSIKHIRFVSPAIRLTMLSVGVWVEHGFQIHLQISLKGDS